MIQGESTLGSSSLAPIVKDIDAEVGKVVGNPPLAKGAVGSIRNSSPAKGLLWRGFFGPRTVPPSASSTLDAKEASSVSTYGLELGADNVIPNATALQGHRTSDFKPESSDHAGFQPEHAGDLSDPLTSALPSSDEISAGVLVAEAEAEAVERSPMFTKPQKWLLEQFREVVKDDDTHRALLEDLKESVRQANKEAREVLSLEEEDRNLASLKEYIENFLKECRRRRTSKKEGWVRLMRCSVPVGS